jgi:hypothetical protein
MTPEEKAPQNPRATLTIFISWVLTAKDIAVRY